MIDLHTHILAGIDDGPTALEDALRAAMALNRVGVVGVVVTPRTDRVTEGITADDLRVRARGMERLLRNLGADMRVWVGHETVLDSEVGARLTRGEVQPINGGRYVLTRLPEGVPFALLPKRIRRLRGAGYIPVLAHVERHPTVRLDPLALGPLVDAGALAEVTLASLAGRFGITVRGAAETLLLANLAHVLASGTYVALTEPAGFRAGMRNATRLVGIRRVRELTIETPAAIVRGGQVHVRPVQSLTRALLQEPPDPEAA